MNHKGHFTVGASQNVIIQNDVMDIVHHEEYVLGYDNGISGQVVCDISKNHSPSIQMKDTTVLQNHGNCLPSDTVSYPRRMDFSATPLHTSKLAMSIISSPPSRKKTVLEEGSSSVFR